MWKKIFGEKEEKVENVVQAVESIDNVPWEPIEVPRKAVEESHIDPRLIVKLGKRGKTVFMKSPCEPECAGCDQRFKPMPPDEGKEYCKKYPFPKKMWAGLNPDGKPKTCLARVEVKVGKKEEGRKPLNPLKASKRNSR